MSESPLFPTCSVSFLTAFFFYTFVNECHNALRCVGSYSKKKPKKQIRFAVSFEHLYDCSAALCGLIFCFELLCVPTACEFWIALLLLHPFAVCVGIVVMVISGFDRKNVPGSRMWVLYVQWLYLGTHTARFQQSRLAAKEKRNVMWSQSKQNDPAINTE